MGWMTADEEDETYEWLRSRQRCKAKSEIDREIEQNGYPKMTEHSLKAISLQNGGYEVPELNDTLYLHFKGFRKIENLEPYTCLTALWLGTNGIEKVEGLGHLSQLRCLYLQQNLICEIGDGLKGPNNLSMVDISHNKLESFSGFECLPLLETLIANHNALRDAKIALGSLRSCPALKTLDVGNNSIGKITETGEDVVDVLLLTLPNLASLTAAGNPFYQDALNLRKRMLAALPLLNYLDRPVFEAERVAITAWAEGGREAELKARKVFAEAKHQKQRNQIIEFRSWQEVQRYEAKKAKEARGGDPIPLTPNETRIIEERNKAAAAEREHERRVINEVGLGKLGDMCCTSMTSPSIKDGGGVQREFGGTKVLSHHQDLCNSNSKDDSGVEKELSSGDKHISEEEAGTTSISNIFTNRRLDDRTSNDSHNAMTSGYDNHHHQNEGPLDIDYQVATSPSSQVNREENENSSGPSFVAEDQLIEGNVSGTRHDVSCDENSERPQVVKTQKSNDKLFSPDSAVAYHQPPLTGLLQMNGRDPPPPPQQYTALVSSSDINVFTAVEVINRTGKSATNDSETLVKEGDKPKINSSSNDDTPVVQYEEGSINLSLPRPPLHDADCNQMDHNLQHSETLINPDNEGFIPKLEQLGTKVPSTYKSRYLDSASEGDDVDEIDSGGSKQALYNRTTSTNMCVTRR